ncbi:MAG: TetR/AcrR family transcriptional regulator [Parahaliea sp.]
MPFVIGLNQPMDEKKIVTSPFNRTAQHDAKRAAILSQAARLFNSKGSRATTLQDISDALGLTKTSLYYYVKTKEELIFQCYKTTLQHHLRQLDEIDKQNTDFLMKLKAFFVSFFENWLAAREEHGPYLAALLEIASLKGGHRKEIESDYIQMFKRLRQYLRDGVNNGEFRAIETTSATRAILGSVDWVFSWLHTVPHEEVKHKAEQAFDILAKGLYANPTEYTNKAYTQPQLVTPFVQGFNREEQNRLKQEAFYKAGTLFFNKRGFSGTSLVDIAKHLNVSKGAFYYYIKNKEDLLYHCYTYSQSIIDSIYQQADNLDTDAFNRLVMICRSIFRVQNSDEGPLIRYSSITAFPIERRQQVLKFSGESELRIRSLIKRGIKDGSIRKIDTLIAQKLLSGATNASMEIGLWRKTDNLDNAAYDYFDIFFNGLLPRSGQ